MLRLFLMRETNSCVCTHVCGSDSIEGGGALVSPGAPEIDGGSGWRRAPVEIHR